MDFLNFSMVDRVISLDKENRVLHCITQVPESSFIFDSHFPGYPILPGVFMIETIAQAAGLLWMGLNGVKQMPILFGVEKTRFRQIVSPNSELQITIQLLHQGSGYLVCHGEIKQNTLVANAEVRLKLVDIPTVDAEVMLHNLCKKTQLFEINV